MFPQSPSETLDHYSASMGLLEGFLSALWVYGGRVYDVGLRGKSLVSRYGVGYLRLQYSAIVIVIVTVTSTMAVATVVLPHALSFKYPGHDTQCGANFRVAGSRRLFLPAA